ncbi:hypothetical protein SNE40_011366 [Patella caerulea]|uniref:Uncharacterized protein n=1 Tax=Patella caerulea TaxID=87958 RepID=A0AAN8JP67_PATCE
MGSLTLQTSGLSRQIVNLKRKCRAFEHVLLIKRAKYQLPRLQNNNWQKHRLRDARFKLISKISQQEQKIIFLQRQCQKLRISKNQTATEIDDTKEAIEQLEIKISSLKSELENENIELRSSVTYLQTLLSDQNTVQTMDENNVFTTSVQIFIINLLTEEVGVHHINTVIKEVARLCGKSIDKLSSVSTIYRIGDQRASVSQMHVAEELQSCETTLMSDETIKHGDSYEVFALRDTSYKNWVTGLRNMHCKSTDTCLETLKKIISDINDVS